MSLFDTVAAQPRGLRRLAAATARQDALKALHRALDAGRMSKAALGKRLGVRRSAVSAVFAGNGNVRINTLSDYLHEMGYRLVIDAEPCGCEYPRTRRDPREVPMQQSHVDSTPVTYTFASPDGVDQRVEHVRHRRDQRIMRAAFTGAESGVDLRSFQVLADHEAWLDEQNARLGTPAR